MRDQNKNDLIQKKHYARSASVSQPQGLIQISLIAVTTLIVFSYSMIQISAVQAQGDKDYKQENTQEAGGMTAMQSLESIMADILGSNSERSLPEVSSQYLAWQDKKSLSQVKQINAKVKLACQDIKFPDVDGHVFSSDINKVASHCLVSGYQNGKFYPDNHLKFGDFVHMLRNGFNKVLALQVSQDSMKELITIEKNDGDVISNADVAQIITDLTPIHEQGVTFEISDELATRGYGSYVLSRLLQLPEIYEESIESNGEGDTGIQLLHSEVQEQTYASSEIALLVEEKIIDTSDAHINQMLSPMSRADFIGWLVRAKQARNASIPKTIAGINYFADLQTTHQYATEINIAKTMGLTSFIEVTERGESYLKPSQTITLYEASVLLSQAGVTGIAKNPNDDSVLLTYQRAAELIKKLLSQEQNQYVEYVPEEVVQPTGSEQEPWYIQSIRPVVQKITTLL